MYRHGKVTDTNLRPVSDAEKKADLEVTHADVVSYDGVKVPLTIVHKRGLQRTGENLFELDGYGSWARKEQKLGTTPKAMRRAVTRPTPGMHRQPAAWTATLHQLY